MELLLKDIWAIEVPEGAEGFETSLQPDNIPCVTYWYKENLDPSVISLPPGSYEILFTTKVFNDNQAASVVAIKEANGYPIGYKDYENDDESYREAVHSLESLLRSQSLDPAKNYLLIRKL